jgi:HEAT repeat protein
VPALIVLVIVGVWFTLSSLVHRSSPETVVQGLESGPSVARWQRASELAQMLSDERYAEFKRNPKPAGDVARILEREIDNGGMKEDEVEFRKYLARALGEFQVERGIDTLLKAARTNRDSREQGVRDAAIEALAVRAYNLRQLDPPQELTHPELESTLLELSEDEDGPIRLRTAYALGHVGTPAAIERLEAMVDDPYPATRYNAAVALAQRGNAAAVETLAEMLDLDEMSSQREPADEKRAALERPAIVRTAITAAKTLARENPDADLAPILKSLKRLAGADNKELSRAQLPTRVRTDAERAFEELQSAHRAEQP